jgi:hypothetical protein
MFEKFADMAKGLKDKLDMEARLAAGKQFAASTYDAGKLEAATLWDKYWQSVEHVLVDGLLSIAAERLSDDGVLEGVFGKLYETLPLPVRLVFPRERFLAFTKTKQASLLAKVEAARQQRQISAAQKASN